MGIKWTNFWSGVGRFFAETREVLRALALGPEVFFRPARPRTPASWFLIGCAGDAPPREADTNGF